MQDGPPTKRPTLSVVGGAAISTMLLAVCLWPNATFTTLEEKNVIDAMRRVKSPRVVVLGAEKGLPETAWRMTWTNGVHSLFLPDDDQCDAALERILKAWKPE